MKKRILLPLLCLVAVLLGGVLAILTIPWGFAREVSREEQALRLQVVHTAESWLGIREEDGSHRPIIDRYNAQVPLPRSYAVSYEDPWCAAFESVVALECGLSDIIPPECGCDPQIALFQNLGCWVEADDYVPLPGDLIYYDWDVKQQGSSTGWSDHVGIVVGIKWPFVKVIEGNKDDAVAFRIIPIGHRYIRGYAMPDYSGSHK